MIDQQVDEVALIDKDSRDDLHIGKVNQVTKEVNESLVIALRWWENIWGRRVVDGMTSQ
jgi:hypothetical protein